MQFLKYNIRINKAVILAQVLFWCNVTSNIEERTQIATVWKQSAQENIWIQENKASNIKTFQNEQVLDLYRLTCYT
jgi:hypothetical protein